MERATQLIFDIVGGKVGAITDITNTPILPKAHAILLRRSQITRLLGISIVDETVVDILSRLEMHVQSVDEGWKVQAPSFRFDVYREADLIEEIARIYGYDRIPMQRMQITEQPRSVPDYYLTYDRLSACLVDRGFCEAVTYSFVNPTLQQQLMPQSSALALTNPISNELSVMRMTLWPGLLTAYMHNQAHQCHRVRLFELGRCFLEQDEGENQPMRLGLLAAGLVMPEQWGVSERSVDFFDMKADIEALLALTSQSKITWQPGEHSALHPGQSAQCIRNGKSIGWVGILHPMHVVALDLPFSPVLAELDISALIQGQPIEFENISKFPSIRRDLAFVIDEKIEAATLLAAMKHAAGPLCSHADLFDIYQGDGIEPGKKSIAIALYFQDFERTLTDSEINAIIQTVVAHLRAQFGANLRA